MIPPQQQLVMIMKYYAFMSITWCFYIIFSFIIIYAKTAQGWHYVVDKTEHILVNSEIVSIYDFLNKRNKHNKKFSLHKKWMFFWLFFFCTPCATNAYVRGGERDISSLRKFFIGLRYLRYKLCWSAEYFFQSNALLHTIFNNIHMAWRVSVWLSV